MLSKILHIIGINNKNDAIIFAIITCFASFGAFAFFCGATNYQNLAINITIIIVGISFMFSSWIIKANPTCKDISFDKFIWLMVVAMLASVVKVYFKFVPAPIYISFTVPIAIWGIGSNIIKMDFWNVILSTMLIVTLWYNLLKQSIIGFLVIEK